MKAQMIVKLLRRATATAGLALGAAAAEITLPPETARLVESPLPGYALATTHCYTCHSTDYVRMQPPGMTRVAWKASVVKMQKTFGAPIPDSAVDAIAEYLVRTYGAERGTPGSTTAAPSAAKSEPAARK